LNSQKSARTKKKYTQLVETAKRLFLKHGIKRVTVEEICEKASVSKVTFYKYFPDKMKLAHIIVELLNDEGFSKFDEINQMDIPYPDKVDLMTQWRAAFLSQMATEFIDDALVFEDVQKEVENRYLRNIVNAQEKGEIRPDLSPELILLVTEKLNEIVKDGSWKAIFTDFNEFQRQIRQMYYYGLLEKK
jgi:AcrR family transcriptional regulator